jgi:hypothetical protein
MRRGFGPAKPPRTSTPQETLLESINRIREDIEKLKVLTSSRRRDEYGSNMPYIAAHRMPDSQ